MTTQTHWEHDGAEPGWVEEFMDANFFVVRAEMPRLDLEKDVDISVHDGLVHIKAQRKQPEKDKTYVRSEVPHGVFERTVPLTAEDVKATYADGVLEIRVPFLTVTSGAAYVPVRQLS